MIDDDDDDPYFREFVQGELAHAARQAELADPRFRHTPACVAARKQWKLDDREWQKQWPKFCRECEGFGSCAGYDDAWLCEECSEKGLCARCGAAMPDGEWPCANCGFEGDPERPEEPECNCVGDGKNESKRELPL